MPVLVVVGGLPGTGKSTVAEALARRRQIPFLRVDRVEQAVVDHTTLTHPVGPVGYAVVHRLAVEQLAIGLDVVVECVNPLTLSRGGWVGTAEAAGAGLDVVVECVNPLTLSRGGWVGTAEAAGAGLVQVELVCSDVDEHRRRVEGRTTDVEGLVKPTWAEVLRREWEPWPEPHLVLDSAAAPVDTLVHAVEVALHASRSLSNPAP